MSRVRGKNTKPELAVRSMIHRMGFRFSLHRTDLPGRPDIVLPRHRKVVFVHGCFWHGHPNCPRAARPTSNRGFWDEKLNANITRDTYNLRELRTLGWHPLVVWECETRRPEGLLRKLERFLPCSVCRYVTAIKSR
jgi:DNA mismatch endonuclease (patch repair protein)